MKQIDVAGATAWRGVAASLALVDGELAVPAQFPDGTKGFIPLKSLKPKEVIRFRKEFGPTGELPASVQKQLQDTCLLAAIALR